VSALMDDIEPHDPTSPAIIHVVSYSEAAYLADPPVINASIQITRAAIQEYRRLRACGKVEDMAHHSEVQSRTEALLDEARTLLRAIEAAVPDPYTAEGLYALFAAGFLPTPYLWECRDEFPKAIEWRTHLIKGGMTVVDEAGQPIPASRRAQTILAAGH